MRVRLHLKEWRLRRGLTQQELADLAGMDVASVNQIERGKSPPRPSSVRKLARALKIKTEQLVEVMGNGEPAAR
jgi:transcriptional regulator with XRE-family HTH domain